MFRRRRLFFFNTSKMNIKIMLLIVVLATEYTQTRSTLQSTSTFFLYNNTASRCSVPCPKPEQHSVPLLPNSPRRTPEDNTKAVGAVEAVEAEYAAAFARPEQ